MNTIEESGKDRVEKTCANIFKNPLLQNNNFAGIGSNDSSQLGLKLKNYFDTTNYLKKFDDLLNNHKFKLKNIFCGFNNTFVLVKNKKNKELLFF